MGGTICRTSLEASSRCAVIISNSGLPETVTNVVLKKLSQQSLFNAQMLISNKYIE